MCQGKSIDEAREFILKFRFGMKVHRGASRKKRDASAQGAQSILLRGEVMPNRTRAVHEIFSRHDASRCERPVSSLGLRCRALPQCELARSIEELHR
jgi:hypothetical protein